ncbi:MAG: TIGR03086 family metal-binding protein [Acidimicrobiales bacterium]
MTNVQDRYRQVSNGFDTAVKAVTPDNWEAQSPCEQWKARDVVAHVVEGHRGVIAGVRGGKSEPMGADEDPREAWEEATRAIDEITRDPEALAIEIDGPTGRMPADQIIGQFVTMDLLVHTWDLARTAGADERLDEDSVRRAYEALKPMDTMIRQPYVFGPKLEPPPGADLQTEFLYFLGRRA